MPVGERIMSVRRHVIFAALLAALALTGCMTAEVNYSLAHVQPVARSRFASASLHIAPIRDLRYKDKSSVSSYVRRNGMYGTYSVTRDGTRTIGLRPTPDMSDYREIFRGVRYSPDNSYYCAPDRLYWVGDGPLTGIRAMLVEHIGKTGLFRSVGGAEGGAAAANGADYTLRLEARRFLSLKERRPVADVIAVLGTGYLLSSDEIVSVQVDWKLERRDGKVVAEGVSSFGFVESHHCHAPKNKPFKLNSQAARMLGDDIASRLAEAAR